MKTITHITESTIDRLEPGDRIRFRAGNDHRQDWSGPRTFDTTVQRTITRSIHGPRISTVEQIDDGEGSTENDFYLTDDWIIEVIGNPGSGTQVDPEPALPEQTCPALSRTDREFLQHLAFRQAGPADEPCWVHRKPRNRWHLIVWTMMRSYERSPFVKNGKTLARLEAFELIEYGPEMNLPEPYAREHGSTIMLTATGYTAIRSTAPPHLSDLRRRAFTQRNAQGARP